MSDTDDQPAQLFRVSSLYRYPVKGLTPDQLKETNLTKDECISFDRAYAIENGLGRFDPINPRHLPKINFLMLMRDERLATLRSSFDDQTEILTIFRKGGQVARGQLSTPLGRRLIEQFLSSYFSTELRGAPRIVQATGHSFSDVPVKCLHIVNLATVRELERISGRVIDPLRFRANVYVDGIEPFQEFTWLGQRLRIDAVELAVFARTDRCDATNVDPETASRDMSIPSLLQRHWGHTDFGVYAKVAVGGRLAAGTGVSLLPQP